jgi:hypothetical protein
LSITAEALADNKEEEMSYGRRLLEDTEEPGYESSRSSSLEVTAVPKKRKFKWKENTVPRSQPKRTKAPFTAPKNLEMGIKSRSPSLEVEVPSISQSTKSIDKIFAVGAARRAREEQEIARVKEIQASITVDSDFGIATCARCNKWFEKGENTDESCVFHSGDLFPASILR